MSKLPPVDGLDKIRGQIQKAIHFGFQWSNVRDIVEKLQSECDEVAKAVEEAASLEDIQDEIGDVFHVLVSLCHFLDLDLRETLDKSADKFDRRYQKLQTVAAEAGYQQLKGLPMERLVELWNQAKAE